MLIIEFPKRREKVGNFSFSARASNLRFRFLFFLFSFKFFLVSVFGKKYLDKKYSIFLRRFYSDLRTLTWTNLIRNSFCFYKVDVFIRLYPYSSLYIFPFLILKKKKKKKEKKNAVRMPGIADADVRCILCNNCAGWFAIIIIVEIPRYKSVKNAS